MGDRLRTADISELDLRLLDGYRRSFTDAYEDVVGRIRDQLGLEPTGRPAKTRTSIIGKLRREKTRLSRMQDIAGCRLVVADTMTQNVVVAQLAALFERSTVVDRREHPSHGYRAVHIIIPYSGKLIEVQVRTSLQHLWAEVSEKFSDVVDPSIKYGIGDKDILLFLADMSDRIMQQETKQSELDQHIETQVATQQWPANFFELAWDVYDMKEGITQALNTIGEDIPRLKGRKDDLSD